METWCLYASFLVLILPYAVSVVIYTIDQLLYEYWRYLGVCVRSLVWRMLENTIYLTTAPSLHRCRSGSASHFVYPASPGNG